MTRQSPASLRARSSNLSLRSAGPSMTNTQVDANRHMVGQSLWESSIREEGTGHSGAFIAAGMEGRPANQNTVCMDCYKQLTRQDRLLVTPALTGSCKLCAFYAVKPEAFTKPYCDFMTENPTIFHTVVYAKSKLEAAGYQEVGPGGTLTALSKTSHTDSTCPFSYQGEMHGPASLRRAASTTPPETAAPSSPSQSARPTSPATVWP